MQKIALVFAPAALVTILAVFTVSAVPVRAEALDPAKIEQLTGAKGQLNEKERVLKVSLPRSDLSVTIATMKIVIWARVSSREQREGYSIDAQLRFCRAKAQREGWTVAREFAVAESAKHGAERVVFNEMFNWVRRNARKERIGGILSHKLDRVCRNIRDAVRMQELEDTCGVKLAFVDNEFGPGAAGALSFNVMAAVAQYYSDNLRTEVLKGRNEKAEQGWLPAGAPYGYTNVKDRDKPIQPHPSESKAVIRMFELYARGDTTFKRLADQLLREGHVYRPTYPRFTPTAVSYILNNRFYIGQFRWHKKEWRTGRHDPLIDVATFQRCQV